MSRYIIEKGIPIPVPQTHKESRFAKFLFTWEVGDSTVLTQSETSSLRRAALDRNQRITARILPDGRFRVWRLS